VSATPIIDAWAQIPVRADQIVPEVRRLLERSGTAGVLDRGVDAGGHIGHPWTEEMIGLAAKHDNVFIDTCAYAPRYYPPALVHFLSTYGQDKVLFGTNFPQLPFERCAQEVRDLGLTPGVATKFLSGNARRVFGL
jgi:predicted TIM-barrel fold metal-dependent hydrolase